jgi:hypothetical protein
MEGDPNGAPVESAEAPPAIEVVRGAAAGDIELVPRTDDAAGAPAGEQSDPSQATADPGADAGADAEATAQAAADDQADLETYPESVRDYLKGIPQEHRKTLHEHFGQRERERMLEEKQRADAAEAITREAEAKAQGVRASQGKFLGLTPIDLTDSEGNVVPGPTYDELTTALQTRRGREGLWDTYSLEEATAEAVLTELNQRREMLNSSAQHFEDGAWGQLAARFKAGLEAINGVDADAAVAGATGPEEVLARVAASLEDRHGREMAAMRRDYDGRIDALTVNTEGMKGRVVAAESRRLATGGRTGGGAALTTLERLKAEAGSPEQFAQNAKDGLYAGIDLSK